ncbi:uncharacterized protein [Rutidosis leptorrhynchoides]|uniref:uncharacterized protein n=1 Tax=Rutidosis leptorrhynchoides TaxID=125765 RepID=UPI003A9A30BD
MRFFGGGSSTDISYEVVEKLIDILNMKNELVKLFRTARDKINDPGVPELKVRLYSVIGTRQYKLPTSDPLGAIVYDFGDNTRTDYDLVIECKGGLTLRDVGRSRSNKKKNKMTMNMFYSYQLHDRYNKFGLLSRYGRLYQQYIVTAYCSLEFDRLDYVRNHQQGIRNEYLSGLYDALHRGDHFGSDIGSRTILPASFTGGPRYMYNHYLDVLAIYRVHGNPRYFITFICNSKWPEIRRYIGRYQYLTANDRADIVARVFYMKLKMIINVLKEEELFGSYTAVLCTIEFQKRGLPHCHTLLWIKSASKLSDPRDVDQYVSAELPDPKRDPDGFNVVSEMMMHGPCGSVNKDVLCMQNIETDSSATYIKTVMCTKKFPKHFNESTYFDKDGFVHYLRRDMGISVDKGICKLDNGCVVRYNRALCLRFHAHINVECTSFKDVLTVKGHLYCTYREAYLAMDLLGDDTEWLSAIEEASATSAEIRTLFSHILMFCDVTDPLRLWRKTWKLMSDDIPIRAAATLHMSRIIINSNDLEGYVLYELQILLNGHSRNVTDFGLPAVPQNLMDDLHNGLIMEERNYDREALAIEKKQTANTAQSETTNGVCDSDELQRQPKTRADFCLWSRWNWKNISLEGTNNSIMS